VTFGGSGLFNLNLRNVNREFAKVEPNLDLGTLYGRYADLYLQANPTSLELNGVPAYLNLRKLYMSMFLPFGDLSLGRQIVNFGKGTVFSPIDVFSRVDLLELTFRHQGSDVGQLAVPFSDLSGVEAIVEDPASSREHSSAIKLYANTFGWDLAAVALHRHVSEETLAAIVCKGDAFVGVYGEVVPH